ncbi:RHS repeat-associated core domain-containing protein [Sinosporangium siamense]|uniref:RHS repeat-associated core domain-containing protein n=1 Tax=Sinosporangium siamense TaxID=1367973 RepID=UPI0035EA49D7
MSVQLASFLWIPPPAPAAAQSPPVPQAGPGAAPVNRPMPKEIQPDKALRPNQRPPVVPLGAKPIGKPTKVADAQWSKLTKPRNSTNAFTILDLRSGYILGDTSLVAYFTPAAATDPTWTGVRVRLYAAGSQTEQASTLIQRADLQQSFCGGAGDFCRSFGAADGWTLTLGQQYFITVAAVYPAGNELVSGPSNHAGPRRTHMPPPVPNEQAAGCGCGNALALTAAHQATRGQGVNTGTGAYVRTERDLAMASFGPQFASMRTYSSMNRGASPIGPGWAWSYDMRVTPVGTGGDVLVRAEDGAQGKYTPTTANNYRRPAGARSTLVKTTNGWELKTPRQIRYVFDGQGRLTAVLNARDVGVRLAYTAPEITITDASGRTAKARVENGLIQEIRLPDGRNVNYQYTNGILTSVLDARGFRWTYTYGANGLISTVVNPHNKTVVTNDYTPAGRVAAQRDALAKQTNFAWDATKEEAATTDPDGVTIYDGYRGNTLVYSQRSTGDSDNHRYDADLNRDLVVNGNQHQHEATYDSSGNRTSSIAPRSLNFSENTTFDARNNPTQHTDAMGRVWRDTYNQYNELVRSVDPENHEINHTYDNRGLLQSTTDQRGKVWRYEYIPAGSLNAGLLKATVSPTGRRSEIDHDATGRAVATVDPRGTVAGANRGEFTTVYTYDAQDRTVRTLEPGKIGAWRNGYDETGRLVRQQTPTDATTDYFYLDNGLLESVKEPRRTMRYKYTDAGRKTEDAAILRTRDPIRTTYTYNGKGLLKTVTTPRGNEGPTPNPAYTTTYFYDANDNPIRMRRPYPLPGGAVGYTDRDIKVDALDRTTGRTDELGKHSGFQRDNNGQITATTDTLNRTTTMTYDRSGRQTELKNPANGITKTEYDAAGNKVKETDPEGGITTYTYDDDGLLTSVIEPRGNVAGANPADFTTRYEYDQAGNQTKTIDPLGNTSSAAFDASNRVRSQTDAKGRTTHYTYREDNLPVTVHTPDTPYNPNDPQARSTVYAYSTDGLVESVRDPAGRYTRMAYDDIGRLTTRTDPLGRYVEVTYDAESNPLTAITIKANEWVSPADRERRTIVNTYDILGRRTKTNLGSTGPQYRWEYDAKDRTIAYVDPTGVRDVAYDDEDQITRVTRRTTGQSDETFTYAYDNRGNITSRHYPDGTQVTSAYDAAGRQNEHTVTGGVAGGPSTWRFGYDPGGRRTTTTLPSATGLTERRDYDKAGRLTSIKTAAGTAAPVSAFDLTLDQVGNPTKSITTRGSLTETVSYAYDDIDRVTSACYSATTCAAGTTTAGRIDYAYDLVGNRTSQTRTGSVGADTTTYTYDDADQLTRESVTRPGSTVVRDFEYDVNGNQTRAGADNFTYNLDNSLATATVDGRNASFTYDATGLRLSAAGTTGTQRWSWDVNGTLPQIALDTTVNANGTVLEKQGYVHGPEDEPLALLKNATHAYTHDWLGGVANMLSPTGQVEAGYDYDPFGNPRTGPTLPLTTQAAETPPEKSTEKSTSTASGTIEGPKTAAVPNNPMRYAGGYQDNTTGNGNYYLRERNYNPGTGRFTSTDPMPTGPSKTSAYTYASNNPLVYTDPTGMTPAVGATKAGAGNQPAGPTPEDVAKAHQIQSKGVIDVILEAGGQILTEILGVNDIIKCLSGDLGACVWVIVDAIPWSKIFQAKKIVEAIWRAGRAVLTFFQELKWAKAILAGAQRAAETAKAAAAKAAKAAADKAAATKAAAEAHAKKVAAQAAERTKAASAKAKAKTRPKPKSTPNGTNCPIRSSFVPGTLVLMADGTKKPIEDIDLGDKVTATDPATGKSEAKNVIALMGSGGDKTLIEISVTKEGVRGPPSHADKLIATDNHPFWVPSLRAWVPASQLEPGMLLRTSAGTYVQVATVKTRTAKQNVHNLTVADLHTYYALAGDTPVLVHNCGDGAISNSKPDALTFEQMAADFEGVSAMAAGSAEFKRAVEGGGEYLWTVGEQGNLNIVRKLGGIHHTIASGGSPVVGAGQITFKDGKVTSFDNFTGHYTPPCAQCAASFIQNGVDAFALAGTRIPLAVIKDYGGRAP